MPLLTESQKAEFAENGVLVLRGFYDVDAQLKPLQRALYDVIGLVAQRHGLALEREPFHFDNFDSGYGQLIAANRAYGAEVYDVVKQIPAFLRLVSCERNEQVFKELRAAETAGIGWASYGIRIDNPNEEKFRSHWHQEFLYQPQSLDGVVLWTPLVPVTPEIGPVQVCLKSHRDGLCVYEREGAHAHKQGAYKLGIRDEEIIVARYTQAAPLAHPGDLILMDFLTIHQSGYNVSNRSRWSVQTRYFNFREPTGMRIGWKASVTTGTDIESIFPDNFV